MTLADASADASPRRRTLGDLPIWVGLAALALPTCWVLAHTTWSREDGAHGPIVLATGAWLLWRQIQEAAPPRAPSSLIVSAGLVLLGLVSYAFGAICEFVTIETGGVYLVGLGMLYSRFGGAFLLRTWFPLLYLAFAIPPPSELAHALTSPLKEFVSWAATSLLHATGLPVERGGVVIFAGPYQLLVEDACSGMNSLFGLTAISLFYLYLRRGQMLGYFVLMLALVIPMAVIANILRIIILVLLTYFFGDAVGQSFLHMAAGLFLFAACLALVFAADELVFPLVVGRRGRPA